MLARRQGAGEYNHLNYILGNVVNPIGYLANSGMKPPVKPFLFEIIANKRNGLDVDK